MFTSLVRRRLIWASVLLVLAALLLPAMSAVLRLRAESAPGIVGLKDLCVAAGPGASHPAAETASADPGLVRLLHLLQACEHCAQAPLASALPLPDAPDVGPAPQVRAVPLAAVEAGPLRRPAFLRPAGRAPPPG